MSVRTDTINLIVNVNGDKGRDELNKLKKSAADIRLEMEGLKKGTAEYASKAKELAQVNSQMTELKKTIGITALTQKELVAELNKLKSLRGSVTPFTKEYKEFSDQIKQVENRLYDVKNGVQGFASFFSKIKDEVKQFGVVAAGYLGFEFITSQFQSMISGAGKMSDQLAAVRKTTNLTKDEVKDLNDELKKFDTRTPTAELRDLAIAAGKLGITGKENILGFIRAADQIKVALGEDLGDEAITQIGKLVSVFRLDEKFGLEESILKTGSAINELGAASAANEGYIVDFTSRMAGIAPIAKISIQDIAALGATLDSLGIQSELGSTAVGNTLSKLATDIKGFAKIAGVDGGVLQKVFDEKGALEALKTVLAGVKNTTGGFGEFVTKLGDVGVEGSRAKAVFGALAENLDKLSANQKVSNQSFEEGISITEEFTLQNETFGATLDKLGKDFNSFVSSPAITGFLQDAVEGAVKFLKVLAEIPEFISKNKAGIVILTIAYISYNAEQIKARLLAILNTQTLTGQTAAVRLLAAAKFLLTGNITKAKEAWSAFTAIIAKNPLGLVLTVIGLLAIAITTLTGKTKALTAEQRLAQDVQRKAQELYQDDIARVEKLKKILTDETASLNQKKNAYQELIKIHPEFANTLKLDAEGHLKGAAAIDQFILALKRKGVAEAREAVASEKRKLVVQKSIDLSGELTADRGGFVGGNQVGQLATAVATQEINPKAYALSDANKKLLRARAAELKKTYEDALKESPDNAFDIINNAYKQLGLDVEKSKLPLNKTFKELKDIRDELKIIDNQVEKDLRKSLDTKTTPVSTAAPAAEIKKTAAEKKGESEYDKLRKEAKEFYDELQRLKERHAAGNADSEEVIRIQQKYEKLLEKSKMYYAKHIIDVNTATEEERIINEALAKELDEIFTKSIAKRKEAQGQKDDANYSGAIESQKQIGEQLKGVYAQQYIDGVISREEYETKLKEVEKESLVYMLGIATNWSAHSKKAAQDVKLFRGQMEKDATTDAITETDKRNAAVIRSEDAYIRRMIITSKKGSDERLEFQKIELGLRLERDLENQNFTNEEKLLKEAEYNEAIAELDRQATQAKIDNVAKYAEYFIRALDSLNTIVNNRENAAFAKEKSLTDKKKKNYKSLLDNKLLSQAQYDKNIALLQEEQDKRERDLKRKQAKREKALAIFKAVVNIAAGVAASLSYGGPVGIALAAITAVLGGLQIAAIASAQLPEAAKGKYLDKGDKHSDKSGGIPIMAERGEAILTAKSQDDPNKYTITGTPRQISSQLNSQSGGVSWAPGAVVNMSPWMSRKPARLNSSLPGVMANGGRVPGKVIDISTDPNDARAAVNRNGATGADETNDLLRTMIAEQRQTREQFATMKTQLHAVVSLKDYKEKEELYNTAKKASGFAQ